MLLSSVTSWPSFSTPQTMPLKPPAALKARAASGFRDHGGANPLHTAAEAGHVGAARRP